MDVTFWSMLFSFDIMGDVGFGKDFNGLNSRKEHPALKILHDHINVLSTMSTVPWLLNMLASIPVSATPFSQFFVLCAEQAKIKERV